MNAREANVLLTEAALIDPRMRRDPEERAQMAIAWAGVLADVPLRPALTAVAEHYRSENRSIMPADIVALVADMPDPDPEYAEARSWLTAHGIDPDEFQARISAGELPSRVLHELGQVTA